MAKKKKRKLVAMMVREQDCAGPVDAIKIHLWKKGHTLCGHKGQSNGHEYARANCSRCLDIAMGIPVNEDQYPFSDVNGYPKG